jgi:hypothetical protein
VCEIPLQLRRPRMSGHPPRRELPSPETHQR